MRPVRTQVALERKTVKIRVTFNKKTWKKKVFEKSQCFDETRRIKLSCLA